MKILIFGNPLVPQDSLAINLIPKLQKTFPNHEFIHLDPTEDLDKFGSDLFIIDTIINIKKPKVIKINRKEDFNKFSISKITSMHDFDLAYNLKLLMQTRKIKSVKILGLPMNMNEGEALEWVKRNL